MVKKANGEMQMEREITAIIARTDKENPKQADNCRYASVPGHRERASDRKSERTDMEAFINSYSSSVPERETQRRNLELRREELD